MRLLGGVSMGKETPAWVKAILRWPVTLPTARLALASAFLLGGILKLLDFPGAVAEQAHFGLHPAAVWAGLAILIEIVGSLLLIVGRYVWLAAGALGVLTTVAMLVADPFWALEGSARIAAANGFLERCGLIAGFVLAARLAADEPGRAE